MWIGSLQVGMTLANNSSWTWVQPVHGLAKVSLLRRRRQHRASKRVIRIDAAMEHPAAVLEQSRDGSDEGARRGNAAKKLSVWRTRSSLEGKYGSLLVGTGDPATPEYRSKTRMLGGR